MDTSVSKIQHACINVLIAVKKKKTPKEYKHVSITLVCIKVSLDNNLQCMMKFRDDPKYSGYDAEY